MKNLILFGDSLFGRFGRDYILALEKQVPDITVHNCAAGGFTTRDCVRRVLFIAQLKPDIVCISLGCNDSNPFKGEPVPIEEFKNNLIEIVKAFSGAKVILFPCPPGNDPADIEGAKKFNESLAEYNQIVKDVAIETNSKIIDSEKVFGDLLKSGQDYHTEDGIHLNEFGYEILIKEIAKLI